MDELDKKFYKISEVAELLHIPASTLRFWETMPEDVITTGLWKGEADYGRIPIQTVDGVKIAYLSYTCLLYTSDAADE